MASRRGLSNDERLAVDIATVSATGAVVAAPCYVYSLHASLSDSTTSGLFAVGNSTAAADLVKESTTLRFKIGTAGASGNVNESLIVKFDKPLYIADQLFWANSTGITTVGVSYLAKG